MLPLGSADLAVMPSTKRASGASHKKRPAPDEAPPATEVPAAPVADAAASGGRSKRARAAGAAAVPPVEELAPAGIGRRSSRGAGSSGVASAAVATPAAAASTAAEGMDVEAEGPASSSTLGAVEGVNQEADPAVLSEIAELDSRRARIDAEVSFLQSGGNLLDFAQTLGGPGAPAPAPALRGAAAASAAAKAARLAAQGIVAPPPGASAFAMPAPASRTSSAVSRREAREARDGSLAGLTPSSASGGVTATPSQVGGPSTSAAAVAGGATPSSVTPDLPAPLPASSRVASAGGGTSGSGSGGPVTERTPVGAAAPRSSRPSLSVQTGAGPSGTSEGQPAATDDSSPTMNQATWNIRQWKKVQEPQRNKTHWDYLLQEMEWLSKDFREERQWKIALARKAVKAVTRWHQDREQLENRGAKSQEFQTKKLAASISREVLDLWGQVGRVAQFKHEQRMEKVHSELPRPAPSPHSREMHPLLMLPSVDHQSHPSDLTMWPIRC